jgi:hypothetical protein
LSAVVFFGSGPNTFEGDPALIGTVTNKTGIQELTLPNKLPLEAKGVRVIPVHSFTGRSAIVENVFVRIWSLYEGGQCQHFIFR